MELNIFVEYYNTKFILKISHIYFMILLILTFSIIRCKSTQRYMVYIKRKREVSIIDL